MGKKKESPATGGNRRGAKKSTEIVTPNSLSEPDQRKGRVYIRIMPDGSERRFDKWPGWPCLIVEIEGNLERTETRNGPSEPDGWPTFVKPPGRCWQLCWRGSWYARWVRKSPVAP